MSNVDAVIGAISIGNWINCGLYASVLHSAWFYFRTYRKDSWKIKVLVAALLFNDTICSIVNCISVYFYTVTSFGDTQAILQINWAFIVLAISVGVSSLLCQGFLIWRLTKLVRKWWIIIPLAALALTCFGSTCYGAYLFDKYPRFDQRQYLATLITLWAAAEAAADVAINGVLMGYLYIQGRKTEFGATKRLVLRLSLLAFHSGAAPSICALLVLIFFRVMLNTDASVAAAFCIGRIYSLTLLSNLNSRNVPVTTIRSTQFDSDARPVSNSQHVYFPSSRLSKSAMDHDIVLDLDGMDEVGVCKEPPTTLPVIIVQSATTPSLAIGHTKDEQDSEHDIEYAGSATGISALDNPPKEQNVEAVHDLGGHLP